MQILLKVESVCSKCRDFDSHNLFKNILCYKRSVCLILPVPDALQRSGNSCQVTHHVVETATEK